MRGRVLNGPDFLCPSEIHLQPGPQGLPHSSPTLPACPPHSEQAGETSSELPICKHLKTTNPPHPQPPARRHLVSGRGESGLTATRGHVTPTVTVSDGQPMGFTLSLGVFTEVTSPTHRGHRRESPNNPREAACHL